MIKSQKPKTYGYDERLLSNSMLQAAIVCPVKYKLLYVDRVPGMDGKLFNAAWVGTAVHECIELFDDDFAGAKAHLWEFLEQFVGKALASRTRSLMVLVEDARQKTIEEGRRWGREYKAPEMTGYWKKNYAGLDELLKKLDVDVLDYVGEDSAFEEPYSGLVARMLTCLRNWPAMRIGPAKSVEIQVKGQVGPADARTEMVGTVDRIEARGEECIAICDHKTGRWGYDESKLANSDQFGLYHMLLEQAGNVVVEWVVYDLYLGQVVRFTPNADSLSAFERRLTTNLRYFKQLEKMIGAGVEVPTPAGAAFKTGCPCILAATGDCPYFYI